MSRRKTRVTHMSRRKARSGTRKRKGGWGWPSWLRNPFAKKIDDPSAVAPTDAKATVDAKAPAVAPAVPSVSANKPGWFGFGGGKTRHRRRRHRK